MHVHAHNTDVKVKSSGLLQSQLYGLASRPGRLKQDERPRTETLCSGPHRRARTFADASSTPRRRHLLHSACRGPRIGDSLPSRHVAGDQPGLGEEQKIPLAPGSPAAPRGLLSGSEGFERVDQQISYEHPRSRN